jgi:hypothetical protein
MELFSEYPAFLNINGKMAPLKNISKKFVSLDDFFFHYGTTIKHNPDTHKKIMNILK